MFKLIHCFLSAHCIVRTTKFTRTSPSKNCNT